MAGRFFPSVSILVVALLSLHGATAFNLANKNSKVAALTSLDAVSRREAAIAVAASAAMVVGGLPKEALAAGKSTPATKPDYDTAAKFYFNGVFRDKKHPDGFRIVAGATGKAGSVTMRDYPGAPVYDVPMMAKKDPESGEITVDMDLSIYKKDAPKSVIATVTKDGCLKFPDGNVWIKDTGVAGLYIDGFAPYPKYRRIVIPGLEKSVAVTMVSGKQVFNVEGINLGKKGIQVDFPGKQCTGKFSLKDGVITWADGNVWTKV